MDLRLDGERVVLTAGAAGIGRVTVETLALAGARVVTCDVDQAALDALRGEVPTVRAIRADIAAPEDVDRGKPSSASSACVLRNKYLRRTAPRAIGRNATGWPGVVRNGQPC